MRDGPSSLPPPPPVSGISVSVNSRSDPKTCSRGGIYSSPRDAGPPPVASLLTAPIPNSPFRIRVAAKSYQVRDIYTSEQSRLNQSRTYTPGVRPGGSGESGLNAGARPGQAVPLDGLEVASGVPWGLDASGRPLAISGSVSTRDALEAEVRKALSRPPCIVSFSGGRDSSAILALAVTLARREGLPDPIALTWRFPGFASSEESEWQELVIAHLGVTDWERLSLADEFELLGDLATRELQAHGLLWPPNLHFHVPALDRSSGGSMLTGWDGDAVLGGGRFARVHAVVHGQVRPEPRDIMRVGYAFTPHTLRDRLRPRIARTVAAESPWLNAEAVEQIAHRCRSAPSPRRFDQWVSWYSRQRYLRLARDNLELIASVRNVSVRHPLAAESFLSALAREGGAVGFGATRYAMMRRLFADLLPDEILRRQSKARLDEILWGTRSRAFARGWDGDGIDTALIDAELLRTHWESERPRYGAGTPLQAAWLRSQQATTTSLAHEQ
jgi:hypothetical protein